MKWQLRTNEWMNGRTHGSVGRSVRPAIHPASQHADSDNDNNTIKTPRRRHGGIYYSSTIVLPLRKTTKKHQKTPPPPTTTTWPPPPTNDTPNNLGRQRLTGTYVHYHIVKYHFMKPFGLQLFFSNWLYLAIFLIMEKPPLKCIVKNDTSLESHFNYSWYLSEAICIEKPIRFFFVFFHFQKLHYDCNLR